MEIEEFENEVWVNGKDVLKTINNLKKVIEFYIEMVEGDLIERVNKNIQENDIFLLNVLFQACGSRENGELVVDTKNIPVYEQVCYYLERKGYLKRKNERQYLLGEEVDTDDIWVSI